MALKNLSVFPTFIDSGLADRFNRFDRLFSQMTGDSKTSSPPAYDIRKRDATHYDLTLNVPGWTEDELDIETVNGQLTINGHKRADEKERVDNWIYKGINRSDFQLAFSLSDNIKVIGAKLRSGQLMVELYQEIPESEKPQKINISSDNLLQSDEREVIEHKAD